MADNSIITRIRRESLAQVTSGAIPALPPVTHIALGSGGVDSDGSVRKPEETRQALYKEEGRFPVAEPEYPQSTTVRYSIVLGKADLVGVAISEMALVDSEGRLCAIRNTLPKVKDDDEEFTFLFDDEF